MYQCFVVAKYLFRTKSSSFTDTLSGEAARVCMNFNLQPILFTRYLAQPCNLEVNNFNTVPPYSLPLFEE